jgi:hypothetical protein
MCHANMKIASCFAGAAAAATIGLTAPTARAADGPLLGFSVDGYLAPTWDRSVTDMQSGKPHQPSRSAVGIATLLSLDELVFGGVVDGMPGVLGDGRLSMGGVFGWQPRSGNDRYQVLGEVGEERFSDTGGTLLSTPSADETTLGYVGARLGMTHTFGGPLELASGRSSARTSGRRWSRTRRVTSSAARTPSRSTAWGGIRAASRCGWACASTRRRADYSSSLGDAW